MPASIPAEIAFQLSRTRVVLERHLGGALRALYLFGSAVDGGLKPGSDVDLLALVGAAPAEPARQALMRDLLAVSAPPGTDPACRALEVTVLAHDAVVPWRYPARRELQFGEWLRHDLQAGRFEPPMTDHDLAILLAKVRQHSIALLGPPAPTLLDPVPHADFVRALADTVAQWNGPEDWEGDERNVVLALARVWYSVATGQIAAKDEAAAWALDRLPPAHGPVLAAARDAYLGRGPDELARRAGQVRDYVHHTKRVIERLLTHA
ncbi:aminoglycoside adenylyltransferase family protein [Bordetella sp. 2513F-2]